MTYSDVITLLMTFFILLLTFSTNEPEFFSQVQVVAFGGGGSTGMAGKSDSFADSNAVVLRYRPPASRRTVSGSELPPTETGPARETLDKGLKSLEEPHLLADADRIRIQMPLSVMRDEDGNPTPMAQLQLSHLAQQLISMPVEVALRATRQQDIDFCIQMAISMSDELNVPLGKVAVAQVDASQIRPGYMELLVTRTKD